MSMNNDDGMILTGETEELGEKPDPVLLCPKILHGPTWARRWPSSTPVTYLRLNFGECSERYVTRTGLYCGYSN